MVELLFLQNEHTLIPADLIRAVQGFEGFADVHLEYWIKHGGQDGLCTYRDAFEWLTDDLRDYNLPVRYSNFQSFKSMKTKTK